MRNLNGFSAAYVFTVAVLTFIAGIFIGLSAGNLISTPPAVNADSKPVADFHVEDPQVAAGEWKIEIQTPPCASYKNIEVIYPKASGLPMAIECNFMPVKTR